MVVFCLAAEVEAANGSCSSRENEFALRVARILMRGSQGRSRIEMLSRSEKGE